MPMILSHKALKNALLSEEAWSKNVLSVDIILMSILHIKIRIQAYHGAALVLGGAISTNELMLF